MILGDPKGEHYQSSYKTMRRRGYESMSCLSEHGLVNV